MDYGKALKPIALVSGGVAAGEIAIAIVKKAVNNNTVKGLMGTETALQLSNFIAPAVPIALGALLYAKGKGTKKDQDQMNVALGLGASGAISAMNLVKTGLNGLGELPEQELSPDELASLQSLADDDLYLMADTSATDDELYEDEDGNIVDADGNLIDEAVQSIDGYDDEDYEASQGIDDYDDDDVEGIDDYDEDYDDDVEGIDDYDDDDDDDDDDYDNDVVEGFEGQEDIQLL